VVLCWIVVFLLCLMTASAYPSVRQYYHDYFEMSHRFAGWLSVALVWGLIVSLTKDLTDLPIGPSLGRALVRTPSFWLLTTISLCLVYPWLHLRKLSVRTEVLSSHACRIYVKDRSYVRPYPGSFVRLSQAPLFEWHSFAAIAESGGGSADYSVVVSKAGDWTSQIIADPPTSMWYRSVPSTSPSLLRAPPPPRSALALTLPSPASLRRPPRLQTVPQDRADRDGLGHRTVSGCAPRRRGLLPRPLEHPVPAQDLRRRPRRRRPQRR